MKSIATIVPPELGDGEWYAKTQGTKVVLEDGSVLSGVTKITLVAVTDDIWRAVIECNVKIQAVKVDAEIMPSPITVMIRNRPAWWQRVLLRLAGSNIQVVTDFDSVVVEKQPV